MIPIDPVGNASGDLIDIEMVLEVCPLLIIRNKAPFDEHRRHGRFPDDEEILFFNASGLGGCSLNDPGQDRLGQFFRGGSPCFFLFRLRVKDFDPLGRRDGGRIVMDADKKGRPRLVSDLDPAGQRDKHIGHPCHNDFISQLIEIFFHKPACLKANPFFLAKRGVCAGAPIRAPVAWIDDDGGDGRRSNRHGRKNRR